MGTDFSELSYVEGVWLDSINVSYSVTMMIITSPQVMLVTLPALLESSGTC